MIPLAPHPQVADKVVVRFGRHAGKRGTIAALQEDGKVVISLDDGGTDIEAPVKEVRNLSAAARKAWMTAPSRRVGRPAGRPVRRISVTLRIETTLWDRFRALEQRGVLPNRTQFFENALRQSVAETKDQAHTVADDATSSPGSLQPSSRARSKADK